MMNNKLRFLFGGDKFRLHLLAYHHLHLHLHPPIYHHNLVQRGVLHGVPHHFAVGIPVGLGDACLAELFHRFVTLFSFGIFQFDDVAVLHVLIDVGKGHEEEVGISLLGVLLGHGAIEAVWGSHGEGETMYERFSFLLVPLGGIAVQAVGDVAEVGMSFAEVGEAGGQFILLVAVKA